MREKKKLIYPIEMKDHSVCREEMNRMVYRKKRWTGWWVASPCLHSWWPWPPVSGYRPSGGCSFPGASPGIDSAVTPGHFFFLLPGKYSNVLYRNRVAASFNIRAFEVGLHPLVTWTKERMHWIPSLLCWVQGRTNKFFNLCGNHWGKKNMFSLFCWKLTQGNLEQGLHTRCQHDGWTHPRREPVRERSGQKGKRRSGQKGKRRSPRFLKPAHLWPQ